MSPGPRILVVDDDAAIRLVVAESLRRDGYDVRLAGNLADQRRELDEFKPELLITDVVLPDGNGLDALPELLALRPDFPVIVLSAQNTLTTAVRASERGAFEYLPKPFDLNELRRAVREGLGRRADGPPQASEQADLPMLGRSAPMQEVYRTIARVVGTNLTVLVLGESGTGKELVARAIHDFSGRKAAPFVAVNMAAIPRDLIEAELFGYERGAFTGAVARTSGRFEQASGGTLFLDEIGDMPLEAQTRLLRVLQAGTYNSVGGAQSFTADVRVIAATHQDLQQKIVEGSFREDLYYRLNVVPIVLPPLRKRGDDIVMLADAFLARAAADGLPRKRLAPAGAARLIAHDWPGNVRELENLMRRLAAVSRDRVIGLEQIDEQLTKRGRSDPGNGESLEELVTDWLKGHFLGFGAELPPAGLHQRVVADVERALFRESLAAVRGNQLRAAALLGLNRNTLRKRLGELGLTPKGA